MNVQIMKLMWYSNDKVAGAATNSVPVKQTHANSVTFIATTQILNLCVKLLK